MQLTVWTYEGPPHVGAMRVATGMTGLHYVLHAPQGDTYADLLFTMIERRGARPPVTYTTFQARDLGSDTAELFKTACKDAFDRFQPQAMIVGASCTAELIQDDPAGLARALDLPVPVVPLDLPSYQKKENWGAAETFRQLVRHLAQPVERTPMQGRAPRCNILGPTALGFRHRDDVVEITRLLQRMGVEINVVAPMGAAPADVARLGEADFNVVLYPEIAEEAARHLEKTFGQPAIRTVPIGYGATLDFIADVAALTGLDPSPVLNDPAARSPWWSRSVDSTYLTGKRVFIFGDATHALAAARVATEELGFTVVGLGAYNREFAREVRAAAAELGLQALITDDYLEVEAAIEAAQPELVLGSQMERHIAKRLRIPCAVISAPFHVQDHPARHSPQMGFEGANVLFDTLVHPLVMGLEEHLLHMFRDDFEFHDGAGASHLGGHGAGVEPLPGEHTPIDPTNVVWLAEAEAELRKIPFFVRGKARRNTEKFAAEHGLTSIALETLYDAKSHYSR
ncbi:MAG: ferredoxin:protochlorophyllide reductase (ATP-dependent) subunit B [Caulobacteraceae bacterium]|nr:ferredoxin:protochlorophyllide reductase (ATP-dependent) subunit B [Caulobacteraceae bacterium]